MTSCLAKGMSIVSAFPARSIVKVALPAFPERTFSTIISIQVSTFSPFTATMRSAGRKPASHAAVFSRTTPTRVSTIRIRADGAQEMITARRMARIKFPNGPAMATTMRFQGAISGRTRSCCGGSSDFVSAFSPCSPWIFSIPEGSSCGSAT